MKERVAEKERTEEESRKIFFLRAGAIFLTLWGGMFSNSFGLMAFVCLEMAYAYPNGSRWWKTLKIAPTTSLILFTLHRILPWLILVGGFLGSCSYSLISINFLQESRPLADFVLLIIPLLVVLLKAGEVVWINGMASLSKIKPNPILLAWGVTFLIGLVVLFSGYILLDNGIGLALGIWGTIIGGKNIVQVMKKSDSEEPLA